MWIIDMLLFINVVILAAIISAIVLLLGSAAAVITIAILIANRSSDCTNEKTHDKIDS